LASRRAEGSNFRALLRRQIGMCRQEMGQSNYAERGQPGKDSTQQAGSPKHRPTLGHTGELVRMRGVK